MDDVVSMGGNAWGRVRDGEGRRTCHFRQEGLKLGLPLAASSSEAKM